MFGKKVRGFREFKGNLDDMRYRLLLFVLMCNVFWELNFEIYVF